MSIKKNVVAATIEIEMIQKEMATGSFGLRNPCKSCVMVRVLLNYEISRAKDINNSMLLEPKKRHGTLKYIFCVNHGNQDQINENEKEIELQC